MIGDATLARASDDPVAIPDGSRDHSNGRNRDARREPTNQPETCSARRRPGDQHARQRARRGRAPRQRHAVDQERHRVSHRQISSIKSGPQTNVTAQCGIRGRMAVVLSLLAIGRSHLGIPVKIYAWCNFLVMIAEMKIGEVMTEKSDKKPTAKGRKAKGRRHVPTHATECPNLGCIKVAKGAEIDVPVDGELIHCVDDADENGHYEHIWRLKNDTNRAGFILGYREGYKEGTRASSNTKLTAKKYEWLCGDDPGYIDARETKEFDLYMACRDIKCT